MRAFLTKLQQAPTQLAIGILGLLLIGGLLLEPPAEMHPWGSALVFVLFLGCIAVIPQTTLTRFYRFTGWVLVFGILQNVAWELWHSIYFTHFTEPGYTYVALVEMLFGSTIGDGVIILGLLFGLSIIRGGDWAWRPWPRWPYLAILTVAALAVQTMVELGALQMDMWAYNDQMPLIPVLGIGVTPIVQMPLLAPMSFWLAQRMICCPPAD